MQKLMEIPRAMGQSQPSPDLSWPHRGGTKLDLCTSPILDADGPFFLLDSGKGRRLAAQVGTSLADRVVHLGHVGAQRLKENCNS